MRLSPILLAALLAACSPDTPQPEPRDAWARATAQGQSQAAVYLTVANRGGADRLVSASTPRASSATLHGGTTHQGMAQMRPIEGGADLPAGGELRFAPGGDHVMLGGLSNPLREGERFPLTLSFERAGERTVEVAVLAPTAEGPGASQ